MKLSTIFRKTVNYSFFQAKRHLLSTWLFPSCFKPSYCCYFCLQRTPQNQLICDGCYEDLPWLYHHCSVCAEPLPKESHGLQCAHCLKKTPKFDLTLAALKYEFPLTRPISQIKTKADQQVLSLMTDLFTSRFEGDIVDAPPEVLIPIPLHYRRALSRGHNQSYEWSLRLSKKLSIPVNNTLCKRQLNTPHQQGLTAKQRRRNLKKAFTVRTSEKLPLHVAIIDDVMTTGTTMDALATELKKAGVKRVDVWCIARTPHQGK